MAEQLKEFKFPKKGEGGQRGFYPWKDWMNGQIWQVKPGDDYDCDQRSFASSLYNRARKEGVQVQAARGEDGTVTFRFIREPDALQRASQASRTRGKSTKKTTARR